MKKMLFFLLLFSISSSCLAQTIIPDSAQVYGIWKKENSPYIIQSEAFVPKDSTLFIQPGVVIKFNISKKKSLLRINGYLKAIGTEVDSIIFTRNNEEGYWHRLFFSNLSKPDTSKMEYCRIEYGANYDFIERINDQYVDGAITIYNSNVIIKNCRIILNKWCGIKCIESSPNVIQNYFSNNFTGFDFYRSSPNIFDNSFCNCRIGIRSYYGYPNIINNTFIGNESIAIDLYSSSPDIIKNNFSKNGTAINCYTFSKPDIINNLLDKNNRGITCSQASDAQCYNNLITNGGVGIVSSKDSDLLIVCNTIIGNSIALGCYSGSTPYVFNSLLWDNAQDFYFDDYANTYLTIDYSLYQYENKNEKLRDKGHNFIGVNPQFTNDTTAYFQLSSDSPLIDKGTFDPSNFELPEVDLKNQPRINHGRIDIGCYEFQKFGDWLHIVNPNGNELFKNDSLVNVNWISNIPQSEILNIFFSSDSGNSWQLLKEIVSDSNNYTWSTPNITSINCFLKITNSESPSIGDITDKPFTISMNIFGDNDSLYGIWSKEFSPYLINGKVIIPRDSILIIEPGTIVKFKTSSSTQYPFTDFDNDRLNVGMIDVQGKLIAKGTELDSIYFQRAVNYGKWGMIYFSESQADSNILSYCKFEDSHFILNLIGETDYLGAVSIENSIVKISDCKIKNCSFAFDFTNSNNGSMIVNCLIQDNLLGGIGSFNSSIQLNNNIIRNNFGYALYIENSDQEVLTNNFLKTKNSVLVKNYCNSKGSKKLLRENVTQNTATKVKNNYISGNEKDIYISHAPYLSLFQNVIKSTGSTIDGGVKLVYCDSSFIVLNSIIGPSSNGITLAQSKDVYIINNLIANYYHAILIDRGNAYIFNTTIAPNNKKGIRCQSADLTIKNTIISNNDCIFDYSSGSINMSYSLVTESSLENVVNDLGNNIFGANPQFAESDTLFYSIRKDSPCIDTGSPDTTSLFLPNIDILGNLRLFDAKGLGSARIDIGAVEFDSLLTYVSRTNNIIPKSYNIYQNYPNPFNHITNIMYDVPQKSKIKIQIFNILGKKVKTLLNSEKPAGKYNVIWDGKNEVGKNVSCGIYICTFESNNFKKHIKLTLIK